MVLEGRIAKKCLGQGERWNAVGDDLDGLLGNGGTDDLTNLNQRSSSRLGDRGNVGVDSVARCPQGCRAIAMRYLFHVHHVTTEIRGAPTIDTSDFDQVFVCIAVRTRQEEASHPCQPNDRFRSVFPCKAVAHRSCIAGCYVFRTNFFSAVPAGARFHIGGRFASGLRGGSDQAE